MAKLRVSGIEIEVIKKKIKNMHLAVYPPNGRVRIAVPERVDDETVRLFAVTKLGWIKKQRAKYAEQERQSEREYVSGESHYFQGKRYLLNVVSGTPVQVKIRNMKYIDLTIKQGSSREQRERELTEWYRKVLKEEIPKLIAKWEKVVGISVNDWRVKQMKTKWGTCNIPAKRLWLNLELAKKPVHCLEYIIVHEIVHLLERRHNDRFTALMDQHLPQWRQYRKELNKFILGHEEWEY